VFFCDDFETGDLSKWLGPFVRPDDGGTAYVFAADAGVAPHGGSHALAVHHGGAGSVALRVRLDKALASGIFAARVYIYVDPAAAVPESTAFLNLEARDQGGTLHDLTGVEFPSSSAIGTITYNTIDTATFTGPVPVSSGAWFCFEWDVALGASGEHALFVNGALLSAESASVGGDPSGYDDVAFGITSTLAPVTLRFDDFAARIVDAGSLADAAIIGCE
jgi:hypothetical protein